MARSLRLIWSALFVGLSLFVLAVPSAAGHCDRSTGGVAVGGGVAIRGCEHRGGTPEESADESAVAPEDIAYEPYWGAQPTGEPCIAWAMRVFPGAAGSNQQFDWEQQALRMLMDPRLDGLADRFCNGTPLVEVAAREFVHRIPLPEPDLEVAPGYAVTGMDAFLVIGGQESWVENGTVSFSDGSTAPIRVVFTPYEHVVDWDGDGPLEPETHTTTGVPHPGGPGEIVHVYADAGPRTITSLHRWRADWEVLGVTGTVDPIEIRGSLTLDVDQVQAVRDR